MMTHLHELASFARTRSWDEVSADIEKVAADPKSDPAQLHAIGAQLQVVLGKAKRADPDNEHALADYLVAKGVLQTMLSMSPGGGPLPALYLLSGVGSLHVGYDGPPAPVKVDGLPWGFTGQTRAAAAKMVTVRLDLSAGMYTPETQSVDVPLNGTASTEFSETKL